MVFTTAGGGATQETGYDIDNSLRFNDGDNPYLSITPSSSGSRTIATVSFWIKRGNLGSKNYYMLEASSSTSPFNMTRVRFSDNDELIVDNTLNGSAANGFYFQSDRRYRDPSAWYHIFFSVDVTQANATDGWLLYVNGVQQTKALTYWTQNANLELSQSSVQMNIGRRHDNSTENFDGYLAEYHYIDGTRKLYTDFGEFNDNGVWIPKTYDGGSYGTNGFFLEFQDSGNLGDDTSGNTNDFTATNLTATDQTTDTPTNNFATLNPLQASASAALSEGNTKHTNSGANDQASAATIGFANGKWYWEVKCVDKGEIGINLDSDILFLTNDSSVGSNDSNIKATSLITGNAGGSNDFRFNGGTETVSSSSVANNDIVMIAVDADNTKIYFGVNGTWMNSGDPAGGTGELKNFSSGYTAGNFITPVGVVATADGDIIEFNFGNAPFTISSGNSDANGYGNFEYAVPSGYYSLCTKNLAEYG